jgi:hypothetical protein
MERVHARQVGTEEARHAGGSCSCGPGSNPFFEEYALACTDRVRCCELRTHLDDGLNRSLTPSAMASRFPRPLAPAATDL